MDNARLVTKQSTFIPAPEVYASQGPSISLPSNVQNPNYQGTPRESHSELRALPPPGKYIRVDISFVHSLNSL